MNDFEELLRERARTQPENQEGLPPGWICVRDTVVGYTFWGPHNKHFQHPVRSQVALALCWRMAAQVEREREDLD